MSNLILLKTIDKQITISEKAEHAFVDYQWLRVFFSFNSSYHLT
jgi:hypothetical protein